MNTQPFNVEIFDRSFNLKQHYNIDHVDYKYDYLSIVENTIFVPYNENVKKGDYIRLINNVDEYFGYISSIAVDETLEGYSNIGFKPFLSLFAANILFDTSLQASATSLEQMIRDVITANWINNSDSDQNIFGLQVETISSTTAWTFYITGDDGLASTITDFYNTIIKGALTKYNVGLYITLNISAQKILIKVGVKQANSYNIEADLPSIIKKNITVNRNKSDINKLIIYNKADLSTSLTYYLHSDGTYDTTDSDRITPVIYSMISASAPSGGTFADAAQEAADKQFGNNKDANLIELTILNDDDLVGARGLEIGQSVNVISNGTAFESVLTGYERSTTTKLIFGTIRLDLTKILKEALE